MCTLSKRPLTTSISKTKMGHENIFGRSVRYNRYNLYRVTLFYNKNKKPRTDHVTELKTTLHANTNLNWPVNRCDYILLIDFGMAP